MFFIFNDDDVLIRNDKLFRKRKSIIAKKPGVVGGRGDLDPDLLSAVKLCG